MNKQTIHPPVFKRLYCSMIQRIKWQIILFELKHEEIKFDHIPEKRQLMHGNDYNEVTLWNLLTLVTRIYGTEPQISKQATQSNENGTLLASSWSGRKPVPQGPSTDLLRVTTPEHLSLGLWPISIHSFDELDWSEIREEEPLKPLISWLSSETTDFGFRVPSSLVESFICVWMWKYMWLLSFSTGFSSGNLESLDYIGERKKST